jgi:hypothetical protein
VAVLAGWEDQPASHAARRRRKENPARPTYGVQDTFVRDRCVANGVAVPGCTASTTRITGPGGLQANGATFPTDISPDGRYVVLLSSASNLLGTGLDTNGVQDVYVYDRQTGR